MQQMSAHLPLLVKQVLHPSATLLPAHETLIQSTQVAYLLPFLHLSCSSHPDACLCTKQLLCWFIDTQINLISV